ncbi:glycosyltransferase [Salinicoccus sp. HZC-1]|uniref:glycosyltransferase n=1 Tax=Salinicoccus sp. HZC-1 TaxID=3385497 RepID=UPI00398B3904
MWHIILLPAILLSLVCGYLMFAAPRFIKKHRPEKEDAVSIIIPARNEAHNLPKLLRSIHRQKFKRIEIIVADDGSTDGTKDTAIEHDAKVVDVPKGEWQGKSYACHTGAGHACYENLIFMDADTEFHDEHALAHISAAYARQNSRGVLSVQPFHQTKQPYETFSVLFNIVTVVGMNIFSKFHKKMHTDSVFGPFIMTNRNDYFKTAAHKAAKDSIIEGMGIHQAYNSANLPIILYLGRGTLQFRMYPEGTRQLINGWKKHIAIGSNNTQLSIMTLIMLWMGGSISAFLYLIATLIWVQDYSLIGVLVYLAYAFQFKRLGQRLISIRWYHALIHPVYILFFFCIYGLSFVQTYVCKKVQWKGRDIDLKKKM